ncbi:hypothetical protein GBA52_025395 [Prunus armeniaca]|nr:hypothetical protein GBA52_025395 [Prunus armeniaca]
MNEPTVDPRYFRYNENSFLTIRFRRFSRRPLDNAISIDVSRRETYPLEFFVIEARFWSNGLDVVAISNLACRVLQCMHLKLSSGINIGLSKQGSYKCREELLRSGIRAPHSHCEEIK